MLREYVGGWRDGLVVQYVYCFCIGFSSFQYLYQIYRLFVILCDIRDFCGIFIFVYMYRLYIKKKIEKSVCERICMLVVYVFGVEFSIFFILSTCFIIELQF